MKGIQYMEGFPTELNTRCRIKHYILVAPSWGTHVLGIDNVHVFSK